LIVSNRPQYAKHRTHYAIAQMRRDLAGSGVIAHD
jgi:hypothetical protein